MSKVYDIPSFLAGAACGLLGLAVAFVDSPDLEALRKQAYAQGHTAGLIEAKVGAKLARTYVQEAGFCQWARITVKSPLCELSK